MTDTPPPVLSADPQGESTGGPGRRPFVWFGLLTLLLLTPLVLLGGTFALLEQDPSPPVQPMVPMPADPLEKGYELLSKGDTDGAIAALLCIPPTDRQYSRAQRFIGWEIYTNKLGRPREGLAFTRRAVLAEPGSGNCWEDLGRVLLQSIQ